VPSRPAFRRFPAVLCTYFLGLILLAATVSGQQPDGPAIKSTVNLVNVSFTARDARGALLDSLTKDDVELYEDGAAQKVVHFAKSTDVPLTLGLIIDASDSQSHFYKEHEKDLEIFLKRVLGPRDRAFLLCFGNHLRIVNDFTQSGAEMLANLKEYDKHSSRFPEIAPDDTRDSGTAFYDAIFYSITEKMADVDGRKALLIFSDGEDNSSSHDEMTTIEAAQTANVLVYTIRYTETGKHGRLTARNHYGTRVMDRLAKESGASAIDAKEMKPEEYFRQIAEELRTSYEIGYYPAAPMKNDSFRKISVRAKDETIKVRAKTGYYAR